MEKVNMYHLQKPLYSVYLDRITARGHEDMMPGLMVMVE
jgi:hypothetical protein